MRANDKGGLVPAEDPQPGDAVQEREVGDCGVDEVENFQLSKPESGAIPVTCVSPRERDVSEVRLDSAPISVTFVGSFARGSKILPQSVLNFIPFGIRCSGNIWRIRLA